MVRESKSWYVLLNMSTLRFSYHINSSEHLSTLLNISICSLSSDLFKLLQKNDVGSAFHYGDNDMRKDWV